ncbi:hypothetical protein Taro_027860 [Colocasia esculenta]|uniref:Uncharacterized protein n=1 Tax=Colocasia esculenta TaxID=4460 RepID=A0A843VQ23_COLES|nr:hypothetical protein [Colocasia esculenta]
MKLRIKTHATTHDAITSTRSHPSYNTMHQGSRRHKTEMFEHEYTVLPQTPKVNKVQPSYGAPTPEWLASPGTGVDDDPPEREEGESQEKRPSREK